MNGTVNKAENNESGNDNIEQDFARFLHSPILPILPGACQYKKPAFALTILQTMI